MIYWVPISRLFRVSKKGYKESSVEYSFPFEGEWYITLGGVERWNSHSWWFNSQRYAYDFVIINEHGKSYDDEPRNPKKRFCYGKKLLAPADGEVVKVCDKYEDTEILESLQINENYKDARGNFVIIKHKHKEYSVLLHMLKGSVCVRAGQQVKRGEVLGRCGNSGRSSAPHLHFHIQDGPGVYSSAGIVPRFKNSGYLEKGMKVRNK